jgi:hypothetical protein
MRSAGERIGRLVVAIAFTICVGSLTARAQEEGPGEEESTDMELAGKILPTLSTFFAGDIMFQGNEMGAFIEDIVQHGKNLSGIWLLAPNTMTSPIEIGPFKGHLTAKGKSKIGIKMTLPFPSDGLPHCKVQLSGKSTDDGFSFSGTAKESKCGKDGKELGKGTFFFTAG